MLELKVDPRKDHLVGPTMIRTSVMLKKALLRYKSGGIPLKDLQSSIQSILSTSLRIAVERGYDLAIKTGKAVAQRTQMSAILRAADARAKKAASQITKTTDKALSACALEIEAAISEDNVASKTRTKGITDYEVPRMFFMGMRKGWGNISGNRMPTKQWHVMSGNPCESCIENEDEGPIPLDEQFPSGDMDPPSHIHCDCVEGLYI